MDSSCPHTHTQTLGKREYDAPYYSICLFSNLHTEQKFWREGKFEAPLAVMSPSLWGHLLETFSLGPLNDTSPLSYHFAFEHVIAGQRHVRGSRCPPTLSVFVEFFATTFLLRLSSSWTVGRRVSMSLMYMHVAQACRYVLVALELEEFSIRR